MKDETIDKICKKLDRMYLKAQVVFAWCVILLGVGYALRCLFEQSGFVYVFLFSCIGFVGYKFLLKTAREELREAQQNDRNE